jgi:hypothetical protein
VINKYEYATVTLFHLSVQASAGVAEGSNAPGMKSIKEKSVIGYLAQLSIVVYAVGKSLVGSEMTPDFIAALISLILV